MTDPRFNVGQTLTDRLLAMERRIAELEAAQLTGLLGTDQTIKGCHDRLDSLLGAGNAGDGTLYLTVQCIRAVYEKTLEDNVAGTVCRITTDGTQGAYSCFLRAVVVHRPLTTGNWASRAHEACFARAVDSAGAGVTSAVSEVVETASAATSSGTRDIASITVTTVETSETQEDVQYTVDLSGSGANKTGVVVVEVEVRWTGFVAAPAVSAQ